jgi:DNA-binding NarL/FixJ family response regulator
LVLDLGSEALEALERIVEGIALPPTLLLASVPESGLRLLNARVRGLLPSGPLPARLVAGINAVATGLIVLDQHLNSSEPLAASHREGTHEGLDSLTPREMRVLQLLAEGLSNKQIATTLEISEHTVKFHLSSIFGKLGAASRTEAAAIGIRRGLVML